MTPPERYKNTVGVESALQVLQSGGEVTNGAHYFWMNKDFAKNGESIFGTCQDGTCDLSFTEAEFLRDYAMTRFDVLED